ncbi:hypothetical protein EC968_001138 [Mortierella alpina]|nr:hypothetical protein EC968_001138 [Mortierella alpina]
MHVRGACSVVIKVRAHKEPQVYSCFFKIVRRLAMTAKGYTFCYYVSGHGFGHATRVNQIITELLKSKASPPLLTEEAQETVPTTLAPNTDTEGTARTEGTAIIETNPSKTAHGTAARHTIHIVSDAPQFIFQDVIALGAVYRNAKVDAGVVQPLAYSVDRQKTIEGVKAFLAKRQEMIQHEVAWLEQVGANCVLSDAPFLPCAAASAYGIPACLITNFTFDEVYRFLREGDPLDKDVIACADAALEDYKKASLLLRLPGSIDIPSFEEEIMALESTRSRSSGYADVWSPLVADMANFSVREEDEEDHEDRARSASSMTGESRQQAKAQEHSSGQPAENGMIHADKVIDTTPSSSSFTLRRQQRHDLKLSVDTSDATITSRCAPRRRSRRRAIDVPLVVRKAINSREDVLRSLGVDEETIRTKKMVLVSFGGQRLKQGWGNPLPQGWIGVICGLPVSHELPDGFYRSPHGVYVPDLTHAANIVIGKLGYGTCSECIAHDTALIYVSRPQFIEEHGLIKLMVNHGLPVEMTAEEFETGLWQRSILEADRLAEEEKEGRRLYASHISHQKDATLEDLRATRFGSEGEDLYCSVSGGLTQSFSPGVRYALRRRPSRAKSLAESVNMAEMARGGPISSPVDYEDDPPMLSPGRSRRSASISSLTSATMRSRKRNSAEGNVSKQGLVRFGNGGDGNADEEQQRKQAEDTRLVEEPESMQCSGVEAASWFERRIPHNGGEVCARLLEAFMLTVTNTAAADSTSPAPRRPGPLFSASSSSSPSTLNTTATSTTSPRRLSPIKFFVLVGFCVASLLAVSRVFAPQDTGRILDPDTPSASKDTTSDELERQLIVQQILDTRKSSYAFEDFTDEGLQQPENEHLLPATAILLGWKRIEGLKLIVKYLTRYPYIKQIIVWNNNKELKLSQRDFELELADSLGHGASSADRLLPELQVYNAAENLHDFAKYMSCSLAKYEHCYFQDDDWLNTHMDALYTNFLTSPNLIHTNTLPLIQMEHRRWTFTNEDFNMHAGFSWMGTGSYLPRAKARRLLEQRGNTTLAKDRFKVIDMYFSIWTNQYPYQLVNYLTPLDQKNGWSTEVVNDHWSIVFRNMLDAADRLYTALLTNFEVTNKDPFAREEEKPYVSDRHTRSPCHNDKCLFTTSLDPFPDPKEVVFKGDLQTIDEQNAKFMELDYPTTEFWRTFAYVHAVDNDPLTCWNSFKVPKTGDSFGLRFVKPMALQRLTVVSSKSLTVLEGQITVLASDMRGVHWTTCQHTVRYPFAHTMTLDLVCPSGPTLPQGLIHQIKVRLEADLEKSLEICGMDAGAHERRLRKERREKKADQRREYQQMLKAVEADSRKFIALNTQWSSTAAKTRTRRLTPTMSCREECICKENTTSEDAEASEDDHEYQQMLKAVEADTRKFVALNTQWSSTAAKARTQPPTPTMSYREEYGFMEEKEEVLLKECEKLERQLKKLKREIKDNLHFKRRLAPYNPPLDRSVKYRRNTRKLLTEEERRMILRCFELCKQENRARIGVSTATPIQRTAHYLGMTAETVKDALSGINHQD